MNIVTNPNYDTFGNEGKEYVSKTFGDSIFGQSTASLFTPPKTSIGYRILSNLKSDEVYKNKNTIEVTKRKMAGPVEYPEEQFINLSDIANEKNEYMGIGYDPNKEGMSCMNRGDIIS